MLSLTKKIQGNKKIYLLIIFILLLFIGVIFFYKTKNKPIESKLPPLPTTITSLGSCIKTGCNGEICQGTGDEAVYSICLWKEEYNCYKTAKCEVQSNGKCGWTINSELTNCLEKYKETQQIF